MLFHGVVMCHFPRSGKNEQSRKRSLCVRSGSVEGPKFQASTGKLKNYRRFLPSGSHSALVSPSRDSAKSFS